MSESKPEKPIEKAADKAQEAARAATATAPRRTYRTILFQGTLIAVGSAFAFLTFLAKTVPFFPIDVQITRGIQLIAAARVPDEVENARWPFLARRALSTHAPGSSHGEVVDPDAYAMSFWYDASLVILLAEPYALDFVRHRCRQVARELCVLLPLVEPDPEAPAAVGPRPRSPTQP